MASREIAAQGSLRLLPRILADEIANQLERSL
jgi:hypothetical protein